MKSIETAIICAASLIVGILTMRLLPYHTQTLIEMGFDALQHEAAQSVDLRVLIMLSLPIAGIYCRRLIDQ